MGWAFSNTCSILSALLYLEQLLLAQVNLLILTISSFSIQSEGKHLRGKYR